MEKKQGQLLRTITLSSATILVVSSVIGSGVYKKVAPMSEGLMSPSLVLWAWVLAGFISLTGALSNAEIAGMMAGSGGEYLYFKKIYGRFTAFMYGWATFAVIKTASISSIAYVVAQSVNSLVPLPHLSEDLEKVKILGIMTPFDNFGVKALTILIIIGLTWLNTRGLKGGEWLSNSITKLVIAGLLMIVISGLFFSGGSITNFMTPSVNYVERSWFDFDLIKALFGAMLAAFWAYEGWNTVGFLGGEIQNPNKNLPLALFFGLLIIMGAYALVNFTYLYVLPIDDIIAIKKAQNQIAAIEVIRHFAGTFGATILSFLILLTTFGCTNATILMPPRIYQVMGEDGLFFKGAERIDPVTNTPNVATWMQCVWACALVLSGSFDQLTDMLIFVAFFFYGATAAGVFILRKREPNAERPYKVWGYPIVPAIFVLFCITLIVITCFSNPREAGMGLVLTLTGVPLYYFWNNRKRD
ncbi:MAG: amino acid permease [Saprospiraceae bacterium]|nr:amino acid permease [Saprospiraceae bacterium]